MSSEEHDILENKTFENFGVNEEFRKKRKSGENGTFEKVMGAEEFPKNMNPGSTRHLKILGYPAISENHNTLKKWDIRKLQRHQGVLEEHEYRKKLVS